MGDDFRSQAAERGTEAKRYLAASLDGLVQRGEQFDVLAAFESVHERLLSPFEAGDHMFVVGLVTEAVDVGWIDGELLPYVGIVFRGLAELPGTDTVDGEAPDLDGPAFTED
jgi:hypothetical protein